jgi:hypothetical protein
MKAKITKKDVSYEVERLLNSISGDLTKLRALADKSNDASEQKGVVNALIRAALRGCWHVENVYFTPYLRALVQEVASNYEYFPTIHYALRGPKAHEWHNEKMMRELKLAFQPMNEGREGNSDDIHSLRWEMKTFARAVYYPDSHEPPVPKEVRDLLLAPNSKNSAALWARQFVKWHLTYYTFVLNSSKFWQHRVASHRLKSQHKSASKSARAKSGAHSLENAFRAVVREHFKSGLSRAPEE